MSIQAINDSNFESEVIEADGPVVVDFWAEWCGPCKALLPVVEEVAADLGDKVKIVKVNIDEAPTTPGKYGLRGVPTLMIFKNGKVVDTRVGGLPKTQLAAWVEENL